MGAANARPLPTLAPHAKPVEIRGSRDRRCIEPECTTVISVYNPADRCWLHSPSQRRLPLADR
jgi:hypothetical protein